MINAIGNIGKYLIHQKIVFAKPDNCRVYNRQVMQEIEYGDTVIYMLKGKKGCEGNSNPRVSMAGPLAQEPVSLAYNQNKDSFQTRD